MKKYIVLAIFLAFQGELFSQENEGKPTTNWWTQSSRIDSTQKFLYHARARMSYSRTSGVISGNTFSGDIFLVGRKGIFTNYAVYKMDKMDLSLRSFVNLDYATTAQYFTNYADFDLSKTFMAETGFIWERDDAMLIKNRYSLYVGAGIHTLLFKKLKLRSLLAVGRIDQDYIISVDNMDVVKKPHFASYFRLNYEFKITSDILLSGQADYFTNNEKEDRYRIGVIFNLSISLVRHISLVVGYVYKFDKENVRLGIIPENATQNIGIEVSL